MTKKISYLDFISYGIFIYLASRVMLNVLDSQIGGVVIN